MRASEGDGGEQGPRGRGEAGEREESLAPWAEAALCHLLPVRSWRVVFPWACFPSGWLVTMALEGVGSVEQPSLRCPVVGDWPTPAWGEGRGAAANGQQGWDPPNFLTLAPCTLSPQRET